MAQQSISINLQLVPQLDPAKINVILSALKRSMGDLGKDISLIDGDEVAREFKKIDAELAKQTKGMQAVTGEAENLTRSITGAESKASLLTKAFKFNQITQGIATLTGAFGQFLGPFKEFDKQLKNIGTLGVKNFDEFRNAAIDLASSVPDTVAGVTEGIYNAISAGAIEVVDGVADIAGGMEFVAQASKLAVAGMTDTNAAIKGLSAVTNAYGPEVLNAAQAADTLFGVVKNGVTTVPEMNAALSNVVPIAAAAGVSFEQVGAAIATLTKQGVPTAQATTQMRAAIAELLKPGTALKKVMEEAGVSLATLKQDGLQETMRKLGVSMQTLGTDSANTFSSIEAVGFSLATTGDNAVKAASDLTAISDSAGSVQQAFEVANEGIGVKVQGMLNQIEAVAFKAFGAIGDGATIALDSVNQIAPTVAAFAGIGSFIPAGTFAAGTEKLKSFGKELKNVPAILAGAKTQILAFGKAASTGLTLNPKQILTYATTMVSTLVPSFGATAVAGSTAGASIGAAWLTAAAPLLPLIAGVAAVGAAFAYLYNTNEEFAAGVDEIWGGIEDAIDQVMGLLSSAGSLIGDIFSTGIDIALIPFNILMEVVEGLVDAVFGVALPFTDVAGAVDFFTGTVSYFVDQAKNFIDVTKAIVAGVSDMIGIFTSGIGGGIVDLLTGNFSGAFDKFTSIGEDAGKAFVDGAKASITQSQFENVSEKLRDELADAEEITLQVGATADFGSLISEYENLSSQIDSIELISESDRTSEEVAKLESLRAKAQEVADQIGETNAGAITSTKSTIDATTGELVTSYDISIAKARELYDAQRQASGSELADAQEDYSAKLAKTVSLYESQKEQLRAMQAEATALAESGDDEGAQKKIEEIKKFSEQVQANHKEVQDLLNEGDKVGIIDLPTTVLAKQSLGIEVDLEEEQVKATAKELETILSDAGVTYEPQINLEKAIEQYDTLQTRIDALKGKQATGSLTGAEQAELDELARKVEIAGKAIGRMAPEARGNIEFIKDANGNLVESFDINIDKAKEFADGQRSALESADTSTQEYSASLSEISAIYKAQKQELSSLERQIKQATAAGDTTKARELQAEYNKLNGRVKEFGDTLATAYTEGNAEGRVNQEVQEEVRAAFEATDDEIAEMVQKQGEFTDEVKKTADAATSLGEAFEASVKKAQDEQKKALTEIAGIDKALQDARAAGDKEEVKRLENLRTEVKERAKAAVAEAKNNEKLQENIDYELGLKERKVKLGDSALTIAKKELEIANKKTQRDQEQIEHQRELDRLASGRAKNQRDELAGLELSNDTVQKQIAEVRKQYQLEFDSEGNAIGVGLRLRKDENEDEVVQEALDKIEGFNKTLRQNELSKIKIEAELEETAFEKLQRRIDDRDNALEIKIDKGIVFGDSIAEETLRSIEVNEADIQQELSASRDRIKEFLEANGLEGGAVLGNMTPILAAEYQNLLNEENQYNDLSIQNQKELESARKTLYQQSQQNLEEAGRSRVDTLKNELEGARAAVELLNSLTVDTIGTSIDKEETSRSDSYQREKDRIDQLKEDELLSESGHKKKLQQLEEEHNSEMEKLAKKRELLEAVSQGAAIEAEREKQNAILEAERESLQERIALAQANNDTQLANKLGKELAEIEAVIADRGDVIQQYALALQENITETFSNVGDPEAMKDGFREIFGVIAGALKQQASAAVTSMILGQLGIQAGATGLLGLIAVPAISGLVNAAISAILNPILSGLTSFATGGRVDEPTLAWVGDKSKAVGGTKDTEWVLHDTHIAQIIAKHDEAVARWVGTLARDLDPRKYLNAGMIAQELRAGLGQDMPSSRSVQLDDFMLRHTLKTLTSEIKSLSPQLSRLGVTPQQYFTQMSRSVEIQREYISKDLPPSWLKEKMREIRVPRYALGSGPLTTPQLAIVGDNPREPERVATDSQLREMMEMVASKGNKELLSKMDALIDTVAELEMRVHVWDKDIERGYDNRKRKSKSRVRG